MSKANEPAFPISNDPNEHVDWHGLTKRELIAAIVMQKIARSTLAPESLKLRAQISVAHADALLEELSK